MLTSTTTLQFFLSRINESVKIGKLYLSKYGNSFDTCVVRLPLFQPLPHILTINTVGPVRENWNFYRSTSSYRNATQSRKKKEKCKSNASVWCDDLNVMMCVRHWICRRKNINKAKQTWVVLAAVSRCFSAAQNFWFLIHGTETQAHKAPQRNVFISLTFKKGTNACHFIYI